jgi:hypothetical protein
VPPLIELKSARPLASGTYRDVYQHPSDGNLLVKVIRALGAGRRAQRANWYERRFGVGQYKDLLRELENYLVLHRRGLQGLPFIQHFVGLVETDLGLGMIVGKIRGRDGELAPTLTEVVQRRGLDGDLSARIDALRGELIRHHIVFGDVKAANIVEAEDGRLVIIDGLHDHLWLPVNAISRTIYRRYSGRRFARMMAALEAVNRNCA